MRLSEKLSVPFVFREKHTLPKLYQITKQTEALIVTKDELRYENQAGVRFTFHPNMSILRMKQLRKGQKDIMVSCSGMGPGDHVLDCTMGMASDAIVASFVVGEQGRVTALESQSVIAAVVGHGLQTYQMKDPALEQAMRAIEVVHADYRHYLRSCADQSFDIILFDPMFRHTVEASKAIQPLKAIANPSPLDRATVAEAVRVARRAVLLKERRDSDEFRRLGFAVIHESASYAWGIRRKEGV